MILNGIKNYLGYSDKILKHRLKNKDKESFIKCYDQYLSDIYRFIYFKVSNKEEAEDITSATFLKIWAYVQDGKVIEYATLKALLYRTARNLIIDHYRKNKRQENISLEDVGQIDLTDDQQDILKQTEMKFAQEDLAENIAKLKDEYREIIILRFVNQLSINEIAEVLNKTNGNTRVLVYRALNALRELINKSNLK
jgi:RNA polymerase sigma-70 factor (ECF subfamily)